jgi:hypothetical protein
VIKPVRFAVGLLTLAGALFLPFVSTAPVSADEETATIPKIWIQISPVSEKIKLKPDKKIKRQISVSNVGGEPFDFRVYAESYSAKDLSYDPIFDQASDYNLIVDWIKFDKTEYKALKPGESINIPYYVDTPKDMPGGGQYAVVFAETDNNSTGSEGIAMKTVSRVGCLVFADLGGETRNSGEISSFEQLFLLEAPLKSEAVIKNTGNIDFAAKFSTTVTTLFGREIINVTSENSILPETSRKLTNTWTEAPFFGIFNVKNTINFIDGTKLDETKTVLLGPLWLWITVYIIFLLTLVVIMLIIALKVRKGNKKQKRNKK